MNLIKFHDDLQAEIDRIKTFLNENSYHAGSSFYVIAVEYRNKLKRLRKSVFEDIENGVQYYDQGDNT